MDSSLDAAVREFDQLGGPRGLPLIGNMLQIDPRRFHTLLEGWCAEEFLSLPGQGARRLRDRWYRAAENQTPVDLQPDLMRFTVDVTAGLAFGIDVNTVESEHDQIQQHLNCVFTEINRRGAMPFPYWRYFKLPRDRNLD